MSNSNQSFFSACRMPDQFAKVTCTQDKVIYTLSQLKQATVADIALKLKEYEPAVNTFTHEKNTIEVLNYLFDRGLVKITKQNGELNYNLVNA
ncbi:hypothetical protein DIU31_011240 [Mucilaginibacter rubeus]|uniref:Uncharacterized protein n=2 Tax=Sphingobacteriaceae TaxID=84566 RepID=A0AAE6JFZ3_9SPHI|nr:MULTISPECIES: hypothetical protein [Mucilaginibacter]QEM04052.1 hypothetical protein DIU31_011240 [Mucilaginibacter rubeus]QEM16655.1 hypothetical protein DIU38_011355 [Mucilaginibacter gossypii]QTE46871.1 hypothetical protein J3L19_16400 [Mucilaginibacter rubeus]QTE53469.1 hypothetical protein J3L21_16380 [Mucilaginibacter rubeus]QTE61986.1 hypothetical protein J3L22_25815 [Mucilaginibacter rubeus]